MPCMDTQSTAYTSKVLDGVQYTHTGMVTTLGTFHVNNMLKCSTHKGYVPSDKLCSYTKFTLEHNTSKQWRK